jgi:hypothetical protein
MSKLAVSTAAAIAAALPALVPVSGSHAESSGVSNVQFQVSPAAMAQLNGRVVSPGMRAWMQDSGPSWREWRREKKGPSQEFLTSPPIERPSVTETLKRFAR